MTDTNEAYVIAYGENPGDRLAAYKFPDRKSAVRACGSNPPFVYPGVGTRPHAGGHVQVVQTAADVTWHNSTLLAIFNGLTESGVKRFASHEVGMKRLLSILPKVAQPVTIQPENERTVTMTEIIPAAAATTRRGRAIPKGRTMTMTQQMNHYNELVDQAIAKGLKFRRLGGPNGTSTFATYAMGEASIKKITEALAACV